MSEKPAYAHELRTATAAARDAGAVILDFYNKQSATVYEKSDGSLVTDADLASDEIIREQISDAFPDDPLLTEEGADDTSRLNSRRCWVVDPIDGTNQFVNRTGEFEVLIALVQDGRPVVSVVYQPTEDVLVTAIAGQGARMTKNGETHPLSFNAVPGSQAPRILTSTWLGAPHNVPLIADISNALGGGDAIVSDIGITVRRFIPPDNLADALVGVHIDGSSAYAWEWDFAAPDLIMFEAGGATTDLMGNLHRYNKPVPANVGGIVMSVDPSTHSRVLAELAVRLDQSQAQSD